jgi:hypothetical protein
MALMAKEALTSRVHGEDYPCVVDNQYGVRQSCQDGLCQSGIIEPPV